MTGTLLLRAVLWLLVVWTVLASAGAEVVQTDERILYGTEVSSGYEHVVSLQDAYGSVFCTGTIVGRGLVLTAAHCIYPRMIDSIRVCTRSTCAEIEQSVLHKRYRFSVITEGFDLALLRIKGLYNVKPAAVAVDSPPEAGSKVFAVGYGIDETGSFPSKSMQMADLKIVANDVCRSLKLDMVTNDVNLICGDGNFDNSRGGACQGDSGGPLIMRSRGGGHVLTGTASYVQRIDGKCNTSFETVYMRLSSGDHRAFLLSASKMLGPQIRLHRVAKTNSSKGGSIPETTGANPPQDYRTAIRTVTFRATHLDATICKNVRMPGVRRPSDLLMSQEHFRGGMSTIVWINNVHFGDVQVCIRGRLNKSGFPGNVKVWLVRASRLDKSAGALAAHRVVSVKVGEDCRYLALGKKFGSRAGIFPTLAYNSDIADPAASVRSDPATVSATIEGRRMKLCSYRSAHTFKSKLGTRSESGVLVLNNMANIKMEAVHVNLRRHQSSCAEVPLSSFGRKPMILIGVNSRTSGQGVTTWLRWKKRRLFVCAAITTEPSRALRVRLRVALITRR